MEPCRQRRSAVVRPNPEPSAYTPENCGSRRNRVGKKDRACGDRAFVPYVGSSAPAINHARG